MRPITTCSARCARPLIVARRRSSPARHIPPSGEREHLGPVLLGLVLVGIGTFFAQAAATGFVGRAATADRGAASGIYLASYFFGGLVGSAALGQLFDRFGWAACVAGVALALGAAAILTVRLRLEHFPEKWVPVFRKKMRQIINLERFPIHLKRKAL